MEHSRLRVLCLPAPLKRCTLCRIFTLYSKSLPLDLACRIWDVFCRDGEEFLFRTALGILRLFEDILTRMDFIHVAQFLTRLPEDLPADEVFASIAAVQMQSRNKKWAQVSGPFGPSFLGALVQSPLRRQPSRWFPRWRPGSAAGSAKGPVGCRGRGTSASTLSAALGGQLVCPHGAPAWQTACVPPP